MGLFRLFKYVMSPPFENIGWFDSHSLFPKCLIAKRAEGVTVDGVHFFMTKVELKEWTARRQKMAKVISCVLMASFLPSRHKSWSLHF